MGHDRGKQSYNFYWNICVFGELAWLQKTTCAIILDKFIGGLKKAFTMWFELIGNHINNVSMRMLRNRRWGYAI